MTESGPAQRARARILRQLNAADTIATQAARIAELEAALTPSGETKMAYMGEFDFSIVDYDEDGIECHREIVVPWTAIKEIMSAIRARAALKDERSAG